MYVNSSRLRCFLSRQLRIGLSSLGGFLSKQLRNWPDQPARFFFFVLVFVVFFFFFFLLFFEQTIED